MTPRSRVISVRLSLRKKPENDALASYDEKLDKKWTPRQIITDALLRSAGKTPEMYSKEDRLNDAVSSLEDHMRDFEAIQERLDRMEQSMGQSILEVIKQLKNSNPGEFREFANRTDDDGEIEFSPTFVKNAKNAVRRTFKQTYGRGDDEA